jgi:hypothetical protein
MLFLFAVRVMAVKSTTLSLLYSAITLLTCSWLQDRTQYAAMSRTYLRNAVSIVLANSSRYDSAAYVVPVRHPRKVFALIDTSTYGFMRGLAWKLRM